METMSQRLQIVCAQVQKNACVIDIGCDHGYVAIHLMKQGIAKRVLCTDKNKGPLTICKEHIKKEQVHAEAALSDGLQSIETDGFDTIVIAGMGGMLIIDILEKGKDKLAPITYMVLQPQRDTDKLRRYLHHIGFRIKNESLIHEDGFYYPILSAEHGPEPQHYTDIEYLFGRQTLARKDKTLQAKLTQDKTALCTLKNKPNLGETRGMEIENQIVQIERVLQNIWPNSQV